MIILLGFIFVVTTSVQVLVVSDRNTKLLGPPTALPIQKTANIYSKTLASIAPTALWIWSGFGNQINCTQKIELQTTFNITCLAKPISLSGISDNHAQANFMGKYYQSDSWSTITTVTADPIGQTYQNYTFNISAQNDIQGKNGCFTKVAGVTFAVTQPDCCDIGYYYIASTCLCQKCYVPMPGCLTCSNGTTCTTCDPNGYFLNGSLCSLCSNAIKGCSNCVNSVTCTGCNATEGFVFQGGVCVCKTCVSPFKMFVNYITKQAYKNKATIIFGIRPVNQNLTKLNFAEVVSSPQNFTDFSFSYHPNGTLNLTFEYHKSQEGFIVPFTFIPSKSSDVTFEYYEQFSIDVQMTTNSNIPLTYYSQKIYNSAQQINQLHSAFLMASYVVIILGLFLDKIIGIELFGVWQIGYFSASNVNKINPMLYYAHDDSWSNGLDFIRNKDNRNVPDRINLIGFEQRIGNNFNFMIIVIAIVACIGAVLYFLGVLLSKNKNQQKYSSKSKNLGLCIIKEYLSLIILFCSTSIGFSVGIEATYANKSFSGFIICFLGIITIFANHISYIFFFSKEHGQLKKTIKKTFQARIHFNIETISRFMVGLMLGAFNELDIGPIFSFMIMAGFVTYLLAIKPFHQAYHNYRTIIVHFSMFITLGVSMFYRTMKKNKPIIDTTSILVPVYFQIIGVLVSFFVSVGILLYKLKQKYQEIWQNAQRNKIFLKDQTIGLVPL